MVSADKKKGILFIVSGPSGCGKGAMLESVLQREDIYYSVSATTRTPREGEQDGVNYHFLNKQEFEALIGSGDMLEYAEYCGNYYGTPKKPVDDMLNEGKHVILEIEVQGAVKVLEKCPNAVSVFILPPSMEELKRRLMKRNTDSEETIAKRLSEAENEISQSKNYKYCITNGDLQTAVNDLNAVIRAEELRNGE